MVIYFSSNDTISNEVPFGIGERWENVLSFQTHAHGHKHIHSLQLPWQECLKVTWSDKEDWPDPKQRAVFVQKAVQTRCSNWSQAVFRPFPAFQTPVTWSLCIPSAEPDLLWFTLFWCPALILPRVDFWFCCLYFCFILEAHMPLYLAEVYTFLKISSSGTNLYSCYSLSL